MPNRPPVIEKNLQWPPHGDPTENQQPLGDHLGYGAGRRREHQLADKDTGEEKEKTDGERDAAFPEEEVQAALSPLLSVAEVISYRTLHDARVGPGQLIRREPYRKRDRFVQGKLVRSADDVVFGVVIDFLLVKRRGVQRVEELIQLR